MRLGLLLCAACGGAPVAATTYDTGEPPAVSDTAETDGPTGPTDSVASSGTDEPVETGATCNCLPACPCDDDGDGYTSIPSGGLDCDDDSAPVHPERSDLPDNGIDDDCDSETDEQDWLNIVAASEARWGGPSADDTGDGIYPHTGYGTVFAASVEPVPDVDGDGCDELIMGFPKRWEDESRLDRLFLDETSTPWWNGDDWWHLGWGRAIGTGDIDGNGILDLFIGQPNITDFSSKGALSIVPDILDFTEQNAAVIDSQLWGEGVDEGFAWSFEPGDLTGDGLTDLVIGRSDSDGGTVVFTSPLPESATRTDAPMQVFDGGAADSLGEQVTIVQDLDGDGVNEWVTGAPTGQGRAYLFSGVVAGVLDASDAQAIIEGASGESLGITLAAPGDVTGDGLSDLMVGAGLAAALTGAVYVFGGSLSGVVAPTEAVATVSSDIAANICGQYSLGEVGDLDGDGVAEVAVPCRDTVLLWRGPLVGTWLTGDADVTYVSPEGRTPEVPHRAGDYDGDGLSDLVIYTQSVGAWLQPWPF